MNKRRPIILVASFLLSLFLLGNKCDYGLKPRFTAIEGDLLITGEWPDAAVLSFIVVTDRKPDQLVLDPGLLKGFYQVPENYISSGVDSVHFEIEMNVGTYGWIFVAVLDSTAIRDPENGLGWRNLAGEYKVNNQLGSVVIGEDERPYIKIYVDFTNPYWDHIPGHDPFHLID